MLHAVIMAGGSGTRFWPASRKELPKQLLALAGERTMIQSTVDRLANLVPLDRQLIVTNQSLVASIIDQLPDLPPENVIGEPCKRDTAPCIGLAAALIHHHDPEGVMAVMPSDHVIADPDNFLAALETGELLLAQDHTRIVTFGIPPTYPAESFGYIESGASIDGQDHPAFQVMRFREKPDRKTAEEYLDRGRFYWNSGIFMWRASTIMNALQSNVPDMYGHILRIAEAIDQDEYPQVLEAEFNAIEGTSIDYAVMENYPNVVVVEAPFRWDDVGSWQSLQRLNPADDHGNTVIGAHVGIDTSDSIIHAGDGHTIVTIDVKNLIVVHTPGATLVAPKAAEERVREAVKELEQRGRTDIL